MTEKKQTKMELLIQFIKFGIVGVTNTVVSYVINVATLFLLGHAHIFQRWDYIIANTVAFILSVLWSFYWNNKLVAQADLTAAGDVPQKQVEESPGFFEKIWDFITGLFT